MAQPVPAPNYDISDIALTRQPQVDDTQFSMVHGKISDCAFLWYKRGGEGEPITDIKVLYGDAPAGEDYAKIEFDINEKGNKRVYLAVRKGGKGLSPLYHIRLMTSEEHFPHAGFVKIPQSLNPGLSNNRVPRQYISYRTKAASAKQDNREWTVQDKVDALDTSNSWLVAKILKVKEEGQSTLYHITFVGWPHRWDEWIDRMSQRLLPLGTRTSGRWTGRDPKPPFNLDENLEKFKEILGKVKELETVAKDGKEFKEEEANYLIKGENREYLENVLQAEIEDVDTLVPLIQDYLQTNIRLIIHSLNNPKTFPSRILVGLIPIFGAGNFDHRFYSTLGCTGKEKPQSTKFAKRPDKDGPLSIYLVDNINFFGEEGGFDAVAKRLTANLEDKKADDSFETVSWLIKALAVIKDKGLFEKSFTKKYFKDLKLQTLVARTLNKITDDELKTLDKDSFNNLVNDVKVLLKGSSLKEKEIDEFAEKIQLDISLRLLSADVLRKRIDALSQLAQTIRQVNLAANPSLAAKEERQESEQRHHMAYFNPRGMGLMEQPKLDKAKFLTPEYLVKWIGEHKLVQKILGKGSHEQLVKMSPSILKFLAQNHALTVEHIDLLWNASVGGDEGLKRIVYDALADLAQELHDKQIDALFARVATLPIKDYRDFNLNFLKDFTVNAVKAVSDQKNHSWYGLDIFWTILQDENATQLAKDIRGLANDCLRDILANKYFESIRLTYLEKCLNGLREGKSVVQCLTVARWLLQLNEEAFKHLEKADKRFPILDGLLKDAANYVEQAKKAAASQGLKPDDFAEGKESPVLVAPHVHQFQILARLHFLSFIVSNSKLQCEKKHIGMIWDTFVLNAVSPHDTNALLKWLMDAVQNTYRQPAEGKRRPLETFTPEITKYVFVNFLCGTSAPPTRAGFECFQAYFLDLNVKAKTISSPSPLWLVVQDYKNMVGLDALWHYVIHSSDAQLALPARTFLTTLYIRLDLSISSKDKRSVYQAYLERAVNFLQEGYAQLQKEAKSPTAGTLKVCTEAVECLALFLQRIDSGEANKRPLFAAGERVLAWWKTQRPKKYGAVVEDVNFDLTYRVKYDDGDYDPKAPETNLFTTEDQKKRPAKSASDEDDEKFPKTFLSSEKKFFDLFFGLLDIGGDLADKVWTLLRRLPINADMEKKVRDLANAETVDWKAVFPTDSTIKLLYTLGIVKESILERSKLVPTQPGGELPPFPEDVKAWNAMFLAKGGFQHIYNFFTVSSPQILLRDVLPQQCISLILAIINHFLNGNVTTLGIDSKVAQETVDLNSLTERLFAILVATVQLRPADEENSKLHGELVNRTLSLLANIVSKKTALLDSVLKFDWQNVLVKGLLQNPNDNLRKELKDGLLRIADLTQQAGCEGKRNPRAYFLPILLSQLKDVDTTSTETPCAEYFAALESFVKDSSSDFPFDAKALASTISHLIKSHPIIETSEKEADPVLITLLSLALQLVAKVPLLKSLLGVVGPNNLVQVLVEHLFQVPEMSHSFTSTAPSGENPPPKCKSVDSRRAALRLLAEFCRDDQQNTLAVAKLLTPYHLVSHSHGGGKKQKAWDFVPSERQTRSRAANYVGLKNLGCICYMNSAMQQLFMIPKLRGNVLAIPEYKEPELSKDVVYQLQHILSYLQESEKQYINPKPFTDIWMDESGKKPINVGKQEDSSAFVIRLIDRINENVKGGPYSNCFRDVMGGTFEHQLIGLGECPHCKVSRDEEYFTIPLEVKNKKNIEESLKAFVQGSEVEGYNCEDCKKKVTVMKRSVVKKLPPTLCITLKRFVLNFNTFQTEKLDDRIEFPNDLDMKPYTTSMLPLPKPQNQKAEEGKGPEGKAPEGKGPEGKAPEGKGPEGKAPEGKDGQKAQETDQGQEPTYPDEYYKYTLRGVVIHTGTAHSGHYYSFIQERLYNEKTGRTEAGNWYKFNDTMVTPFDPKEIADQCFGGNNPRAASGFGGIANGYLLFYDRIDPREPEATKPEGQEEIVSPTTKAKGKVVPAKRVRNQVPARIFTDIWQQNLTYWRDKAVFDEHYFDFLWKFQSQMKDLDQVPDVKTVAEVDLNNPSNVRDALTRLFSRFFFMTLSRAKQKDNIAQWVETLKKLYTNNVASSVWLLNQASNPATNWAYDFLWECGSITSPIDKTTPFPALEDLARDGAGELFGLAVKNVAPHELKSFDEAPVSKETKEAKEGSETKEVKEVKETKLEEYKDEKQDPRGYVVGFIDTVLKYLRFAPSYWRTWKAYFKVLADFAEIGIPQAAYCEKHNLIAKLVDIYIREASPHPELNNIPTNRDGRRSTMRGQTNTGWPFPNMPDFFQFFRLLRAVVVYQPFTKHSQLATEMLTLKYFMPSFLMEATSRRRAQNIVPVVLNICTESQSYSVGLLELIKNGFKISNHEQVRPYFRTLQAFLELEDTLQEWRVQQTLGALIAIMKEHENFWKMFDMCADHLIRFAKKSPLTFKWLNSNPATLDWISGWLKTNPKPPPPVPTSKADLKLEKERGEPIGLYQERYECFVQTSKYAPYGLSNAAKQAALDVIKNGRDGELDRKDTVYDSDEGLENRHFDKDEKIDALDTDLNWLGAQILETHPHKGVLVKYEGWSDKWNEWIPTWSPRITKNGVMTVHNPPKKKKGT